MNAIEQRIQTLSSYYPPAYAPDDLHDFWSRMAAKHLNGAPSGERTSHSIPGMPQIEAWKVVYRGFDDTPLHGWFVLPPSRGDKPVPCLVLYHGYHGSKSDPEDFAAWLLSGYAVFAVDVRGQGGETGNGLASSHGMISGWISQNVLDKENSYYLATAVDSIRAVDWAATQPEIDPSRVAVVGASQGGGLALLVSALSSRVSVCVAQIPNLSHMDYGILHSTGSLTELARFCNLNPDRLPDVLETLSYFDILSHADRIRLPVLMSVGLNACRRRSTPPSTTWPPPTRDSTSIRSPAMRSTGTAVPRPANFCSTACSPPRRRLSDPTQRRRLQGPPPSIRFRPQVASGLFPATHVSDGRLPKNRRPSPYPTPRK
ncbi:hypothetical protein J31TS4_21960 [Paenibacillus sp. J31TS4]|uniref:acetylxylan esterase n=1 Tax=Paenibacillus sp. J31TS4 TaxID=2807195 RepID=UPI001B0E07DF|nr:alpha/beta fold hydrolase [Paenibacillus sp. J31TS4]GIP38916.1 hypothetical protein J31TS4_21960 [Paenibacillus sp. J31TS4]